jgi:hypothetical protein
MSENKLQEFGGNDKNFVSHVFSTTEEGKAEILNVLQYSMFGIIPVIILNKLIQRFIPEADPEKSTLEISVEILIQLTIMFCGIIIIHRIITYFPTYSGFKYDNLILTNVILAFLVIVLSIQTKLGIKVNILIDRLGELWNGPSSSITNEQNNGRKHNYNVRVSQPIATSPVENQVPVTMSSQQQPSDGYDQLQGNEKYTNVQYSTGPMAANSLLGSTFGAA